MATYVLVHGAWAGASGWNQVADRLRKSGHTVHTPTLTGCGEKMLQLSADTSLTTHVNDVVGLFDYEKLKDVVLVGHSYGGTVVTQAAETVGDRVKHYVYLDAFLPSDGENSFQFFPPELQKMLSDGAAAAGGFRLQAGDGHLDLWGLKPGPAREAAKAGLCDFSLKCFQQKVSVPKGAVSKKPRSFIAATSPDYPARGLFGMFAERAAKSGFTSYQVPTGHPIQLENPDEVARIFAKAGA